MHHLAAPSSAVVGSMCARKLSLLKVLAAGQIVSSHVAKVLHSVPGESRLTIRLFPLGRKARPDAPPLKLKLLTWYLQTMRAEGRVPTARHFRNLLGTLRGKGPAGPQPAMSIEEIREGFAKLAAQADKPE
jgi:hypothetical protein